MELLETVLRAFMTAFTRWATMDGQLSEKHIHFHQDRICCLIEVHIGATELNHHGPRSCLKTFSLFDRCGGEVNCVKWDPTGSLLAYGSDDVTAKVVYVFFLSLLNGQIA
ncbi:hypothetical protein DITRI_Ditri11bG0035800 [Diplodiscus trichospermus]